MVQDFGKFIYRVPLYSIALIQKAKQYNNLDIYVKDVLSLKEVQEAIYLASPSFYQEMNKFLDGELNRESNPKRTIKFIVTALKYINRMACRSTPFGLFAGCGVGKIGGETSEVALDGIRSFRRKARLDMEVLMQLAEAVETDIHIKNVLKFFPNNSLYRAGKEYRYVEFYNNKKGKRQYELSSFSQSKYIDAILVAAESGALIPAIAKEICDESVDLETAQEFIGDLIEAKILISELEPQVIGEDYGQYLLDTFLKIEERNPDAKTISSLHFYSNLLNHVFNLFADTTDLGSVQKYQQLKETAKMIFPNKPLPNNLIQADSEVVSKTATITEKLARDIEQGIRVFSKFCKPFKNQRLKEFKAKFEERYEQQMIPLVEALDPELGIGFTKVAPELYDSAPLVDDLPIAKRKSSNLIKSIEWDFDLHSFLLDKIMNANKAEERVIEFTKKEIDRFVYDLSKFPPTFNALISLIPTKNEKDLIYFHSSGKDSASSFLGRFGYLNEDIKEILNGICDFEERCFPDKVVAEINHLSDAKAGNITLRPKTRTYEIPYITKSNSKEEGLIPVNDLYIGVRNGKIILFSKSLQKEVIPRLSNSHNYFYNTLPLYKFLAFLQEENADGYYQFLMDMGRIPAMVDFIPRFQYRNFIFRAATWKLNTDFILKNKHLPIEDFMQNLKDYFDARKMPHTFLFKKADSQFFIDLDNPATVLVFAEEAAKASHVLIEEDLFNEAGNFLIKDETGGIFHEILVPFKNETLLKNTSLKERNTFVNPQAKRTYMPACEWFYLKIYAGFRKCDDLLVDVLPAFIDELKRKDIIKKWFFIRYNDPDFHLRLRFQLAENRSLDDLMALFYQHFDREIRSKQVWKICIDTYQREIERYAGDLINTAEEVFHFDSDLCIKGLENMQGSPLAVSYRWLFVTRVVVAYFRAFDLSLEEQHLFLKHERAYFARIFNADKLQKRKISRKYIGYKKQLETILTDGFGQFEQGSALNLLIDNFENQLQHLYQEVYQHEGRKLQFEQLSHFIHMSVLRFMRSKNKLHEYLIYALLEQYTHNNIGKLKALQNHV